MGAHTPVEFDVESTPVALGREDGCPHFNRRELGTDAQRASAQTTLHPDTAETTNEKESIDCTADSSDQILVGWDEGETDNPLNWSPAFRWILSYWGGIVVGCSTFISTIPNGVMGDIMAHFKVGHEVGALITALNVLGFAAGPLVFGPLSERVGRRPVFLLSTLGTCLFSLGCSLTPNIGGLLACRFLGGVFAAAPLVISGSLIGDMWNPIGTQMISYGVFPSVGPSLGPLVSGAISVTGTDWRWAFRVATIFAGSMLIFAAIFVKETYAPVLLVRKAKRLRKENPGVNYVAPKELVKISPSQLLKRTLLQPFIMLLEEPMLAGCTLLLSYAFGLLYLIFEFYSSYHDIYGLNPLQEGLCFLPFLVGSLLACAVFFTIISPRYQRDLEALKAEKGPDAKLEPEARLPIVLVCGPCMAVSFFWFGWANYKEATLWAPLLSGIPLGFGICAVFLGTMNYLVETYRSHSAIALAAQTTVRSLVGGGFVLFAKQMEDRLGVHWASSLLGFLALLLTPIPFTLWIYGAKIRSWSKYAH